jgi:hypothetical protein
MNRTLAERELTSEGPRRGTGDPASRRGRRSVTVNLGESPLTWLHARGHLSDRQLDAGERLRADWERAQLAPSLTMSWDPARFDAAVATAGPGLADVLWRVACAGESLPVAEKALTWPVRSGKLVLRLALDRVADFYRLR